MDTGVARLTQALNEREDETPTCLRLGCDYPAPLGKYCGLHLGQDLAARAQNPDYAVKCPARPV